MKIRSGAVEQKSVPGADVASLPSLPEFPSLPEIAATLLRRRRLNLSWSLQKMEVRARMLRRMIAAGYHPQTIVAVTARANSRQLMIQVVISLA